jgi:hypothetical protein
MLSTQSTNDAINKSLDHRDHNIRPSKWLTNSRSRLRCVDDRFLNPRKLRVRTVAERSIQSAIIVLRTLQGDFFTDLRDNRFDCRNAGLRVECGLCLWNFERFENVRSLQESNVCRMSRLAIFSFFLLGSCHCFCWRRKSTRRKS